MDQNRIMKLLRIAARNPDFTIRCRTILEDVLAERLQSLEGIGMSIFALHIFDETAENCRDRLPEVFPLFAALCGDGEKNSRDQRFAKVNWLLVRL